jgi:AcrR family transcriptional regulator
MNSVRLTSSRPARPRTPPPQRVDVAGVRRDQIIEAAARIIATKGIQDLSLRAIEDETGMSRGQLTYYFKFKEDILLAVFDRMVRRMRERVGTPEDPCAGAGPDADGWDLIRALMTRIIGQPVPSDFAQLQYTFLAQTGHRDDFRERLASLYEDWRSDMAGGLAALNPPPAADPRLLASLVQAILHGVVMQLQADPTAFDRTQMLDLCLSILGGVLGRRNPGKRAKGGRSAANHVAEGRTGA